MKRKISIILILCMIFSAFAGFVTARAEEIDYSKPITSYVDVPEGHWAYPWVKYMSERNYIHGYPVTENEGQHMYKPDQWITRAELSSILYLMLKPQGEMTETFTDLFETDWYYEYLSKAVATGYYSGYNDGTMRPNQYITREEASCVIYNAFKIDKYTNVTEFLDKGDISDWAFEAVMSLADIGVIAGYTGATEDERYLNPKTNIKRAEIASLLANADKFYPPTVTLSDAEVTFSGTTSGKLAFDMFPKHTSDFLSVTISEENDIPFTVTYSIDGERKTVTVEEFEAMIFTAEQLEELDVALNFEGVTEDTVAVVLVEVIDHQNEEDDTEGIVVGHGRYRIRFSDIGSEPPVNDGPVNSNSTRNYQVTYDIDGDNNAANDPNETVRSGSKPKNVPEFVGESDADIGKAYSWYDKDDPDKKAVNPATVSIKKNTTFVAVEDIDRVIIALMAYQNMQNDGFDAATVNPLPADPYNNTTEGYNAENDAHNGNHDAAANKVWWTTDLLEIIVTNDKNHLLDSGDKNYQDMTAQTVLKPIYDDVARWVVDNHAEFAGVDVTENKLTYVNFFRAMIKTIDAAAVNAAEAYWNARQNGGNKDTAYEEFQMLAVLNTINSLDNAMTSEGVADTTLGGVGGLALSYVQALYDSADANEIANYAIADAQSGDGLKAKLNDLYTEANGNYETFKTLVAGYIASQYIYTK